MLLGAAPTVRVGTTLNSMINGCTTVTCTVCDFHATLPDVALAVSVTGWVAVGATALTVKDDENWFSPIVTDAGVATCAVSLLLKLMVSPPGGAGVFNAIPTKPR